MNEKTLLRISLVISIAGLIVLFMLSSRLKIDESMINSLDGTEESAVLVTGSVVEVSQRNTTTMLRIQKEEILPVVVFGKALSVQEGDLIQARGKLSKKDGKVELIADELRVV